MSTVRVLVDALPAAGTRLDVPADQAHHLHAVRRVKAGDPVECIDRTGAAARARVIELDDRGGVVHVESEIATARQAALRLTVMPALLPESKFDFVLQKCTEIGVAECRPVISSRCVVQKVRAGFNRKLPRWQKICDEAARQCGGAPMSVHLPCAFDDALVLSAHVRILADRDGVALSSVAGIDRPHTAAVLIGPEGGFTQEELAAARAQGWSAVAFNRNILRAETAAIVACTVLGNES